MADGDAVVEDGNVTICGPTAGSGAAAPDKES